MYGTNSLVRKLTASTLASVGALTAGVIYTAAIVVAAPQASADINWGMVEHVYPSMNECLGHAVGGKTCHEHAGTGVLVLPH